MTHFLLGGSGERPEFSLDNKRTVAALYGVEECATAVVDAAHPRCLNLHVRHAPTAWTNGSRSAAHWPSLRHSMHRPTGRPTPRHQQRVRRWTISNDDRLLCRSSRTASSFPDAQPTWGVFAFYFCDRPVHLTSCYNVILQPQGRYHRIHVRLAQL